MGITEDGILGEQLLFEFLRQRGFKYFQPDAIGQKDDVYYLFEVKHQKHYKSPPFNGHGLEQRQVRARLEFQEKTGIRVVLVVFEKPFEETGIVYYQFIDELEKGQYYDTQGFKRRRIYSLDNFHEVFLADHRLIVKLIMQKYKLKTTTPGRNEISEH
jgi:Holliday junction resolvase